jgi:hypothetical protein
LVKPVAAGALPPMLVFQNKFHHLVRMSAMIVATD